MATPYVKRVELSVKLKELKSNMGALNEIGSAKGGKSFRQDIQGLRAIAVLAVMVFHANKTWLPAGFIGVDVFFVISGYIISTIIIGAGKEFNWKSFYLGRARRIVPAYLFMLLLVSLFSSIVFIPTDFVFFRQSLISAVLFYSNQYFASFGSYFAPGSHELPLLHTWSLSIEMQFYLFLPFFIWMCPRKWLGFLILGLCITLFLYAEWLLESQENQRDIYYSLISRTPEFLIGSFVAVVGVGAGWSSRRAAIIGTSGLLLLLWCLIYTGSESYPGIAAVLPCVATAMIVSSRSGLVSSMLSHRYLVWLGALSYSLYLWHWPILAFARYYIGQNELSVIWLCSFVVLTFAFSWVSYSFIETPARSAVGIFKNPKSLSVCGVGCLSVFLTAFWLNSAIGKKLPVEMTRYAPLDEICHGQIVGDCTRGAKNEKVSVLVLGDSHAAQLNEFFDVVGEENKFSARVITASNCVPIPKFDVERIPEYSRAGCLSQISEVSKYLDHAGIIVVAGMWEWQAQSKDFLKAFTDFLEYTSQHNIKVVVFSQIPMFDINLLRFQRFVTLGLPATVSKNTNWEADNEKIAAIVRRFNNAKFFDLSHSDFFRSAPFHNGELIYQDSHHLNEIGAKSYGTFSAPSLKALLSEPAVN